ncbi:MAG: helix-turn-helix domain-containing protein [Candidatus Desulfaltia sp.]|nr:helix-turn-helix domain-containing protein [Candidatus Desulfaltia sp.]
MVRDNKDIDVYNVKEIAKAFGVDRITIYRWNKKGILPLKRMGGRYFAQRKDIETILSVKG